MNDLRAAAQQALEALEKYRKMMFVEAGCRFGEGDAAITNLRAAMAQQVEPDHETRAELAEQQVVQLAEERDHYRNLWQKAQQAEPLNLRDPAVQKRLASQWGYVPAAAQAEPVEQLAELQAMLRAEVDRLIAAGIQPQRKPLTEEIMHIGIAHQSLRQVVRAVERAHGNT